MVQLGSCGLQILIARGETGSDTLRAVVCISAPQTMKLHCDIHCGSYYRNMIQPWPTTDTEHGE